jgi:hypothetical protein
MTDTDRTNDQTEKAVSIAEAAAQLNTTTEAIRMRLKRGTLDGYRDNRGRWRVCLSANLTPTEPVQTADLTSDPTSDQTQHELDQLRVQTERVLELEKALAEERIRSAEQVAIATERQRQLDELHQVLRTVLDRQADQPPSIAETLRRWLHRRLNG